MMGSRATIARDLGRILEALGGMILASTLVAVVWGEIIPVLVFLRALFERGDLYA